MYTWMQANRKKMLAIFGVLLMIVFILPTTPGMFHNYNRTEGYIGEEEITTQDLTRAWQEWDFIARHIAPRMQFQMQFGAAEPWQRVFFSDQTLSAINQNPELFYLLQREADHLGVRISEDRVNELLGLLSTMLPPASSMDEAAARRRAVENLLRVGSAFERAASAVKFSEPRVRQEIAEQSQSIQVKLVEFRAADFMADIPEPTPEQIQQQIDQYGEVDPQAIDTQANPFGFSYRLPNRVKLQYIQIPRQAVRELVEQSQTEFQWRSQAYAHYQANQSRYETTEPATQEAESTFFGPSEDLTLGSTTQPATQPTVRVRAFEEVYEQIRNDLLRPMVDQKMRQIQDRVASLLQKGFERFQAQHSGQPAPEGTGIAADYTSYDYLQQVAQQIQREFKITPTVQALENRWLAEADLMALPGIGSARIAGRDIMESVVLAEYILSRAEPFRPENQRQELDTLSVWEPSAALTNPSQDVFFVRLTDAQPAHAPKSPEEREEVARQAADDLKTAAAYEKARAAAEALLEQVRSAESLDSAAQAAGQSVMNAGPISRMFRQFGVGSLVQGYSIGESSRELFADAAFDLLREATPDSRHPQSLIELPREAKVLVAELGQIERSALRPDQSPAELAAQAAVMARMAVLTHLAVDWFHPDSIRQRLNWRPA